MSYEPYAFASSLFFIESSVGGKQPAKSPAFTAILLTQNHLQKRAISVCVIQVRYVVTDKTGTLTQNKMKFKMCTIGGVKYGDTNAEEFDSAMLLSDKESNSSVSD